MPLLTESVECGTDLEVDQKVVRKPSDKKLMTLAMLWQNINSAVTWKVLAKDVSMYWLFLAALTKFFKRNKLSLNKAVSNTCGRRTFSSTEEHSYLIKLEL